MFYPSHDRSASISLAEVCLVRHAANINPQTYSNLHNENDDMTPDIHVEMSKSLCLNDFITVCSTANIAAR